MSENAYPLCQGPDKHPLPAKKLPPAGTVDCHAHVFGDESKYPFSSRRGYTPPPASLENYLALHKTLGNIERAVLTQPSVYGTDNSCMLDVVAQMDGRYLAVAAVGEYVTDRELQDLHDRRVRGVRVNLVDKGGMPFDGIRAVRKFSERIKDMGWHLEILVHVHEFENLRETINSMAVDVSVGHMGYMNTAHGLGNRGFQQLLAALRDGNCWVKFTGTYRITNSSNTPYDDVTPFARALIDANEDRIVWGSDWPHPVFKGNMPNDGALMDQLSDWAEHDLVRNKILVRNPEELYGFPRVAS